LVVNKIKMKNFVLILSLIFVVITHSQETITDISGNIYKTVKIGSQIWMAENLRTEKFNNADPIEIVTSNRYWQEVSLFAMEDTTLEKIWPVMCYYNNDKLKNNALYNWYVVIDDRSVCPVGWHIPSTQEFEEMIEYLGGIEKASVKLKSTTLWKSVGTNSSGFNAIPIGYRVGGGEFDGKNEETGFWTDDLFEEINKYNGMKGLLARVLKINSNNTESEFREVFFNAPHSVRCLKN
jgi:uncharacterized protein (TIGR02145 family)